MLKFERKIQGEPLKIEINKFACQANTSLLLKYQDTVCLVALVLGKKDLPHLDFLPFSVEYRERYYAAGKIGGSRFIRRETRPSEEAILTARLIDRSLRPLFPENLRREIQLIITVLSLGDFDPDFLALFGSSLALSLSEIPFEGPVAGLRIVKEGNREIINPEFSLREKADLDVFASKGSQGLFNMLELRGKEVKEDEVISSLTNVSQSIDSLIDFQKEIIEQLKPQKNDSLLLNVEDQEIEKKVKNYFAKEEIDFEKDISLIKEDLLSSLEKEGINFDENNIFLLNYFFKKELKKIFKEKILKEDKRSDGRRADELRKMEFSVGLLPRTHGSAYFQKGLTRILSSVTLASPSSQLFLDTIEISGKKRFIHHYNFPPYAGGEIGSYARPPARREIGHGALVEKALLAVIPQEDIFPYTIRVVSEVLSSNGSSSMGSVCASSLALMDAGVPIKRPIFGLGMGLIGEIDGQYKILSDIRGAEDHFGEIDFKVAGSEKGITACQLDVKNKGLSLEIIKEVLEQAKKGREEILRESQKAIKEPRKELSPYAPKIVSLTIPPEKIGLLVGTGGRTINSLIEKYQLADIDIEEDGRIFIAGQEKENVEKAAKIIFQLTREYQLGEKVVGRVAKILDFGAIIELDKFHTGLLHISEISNKRINKVSDVLKEGEKIEVKIIRIDPDGKIGLSMKR